MMKAYQKLTAALIAASMTLSTLTPGWAAEAKGGTTGNLQATLRLDYAQEMTELRDRGIRAELLQGSRSLGQVSMTEVESSGKSLNGCTARVSMRDRLGGGLIGSAAPGALDLSVDGLAPGNYTLRFTGRGYVSCEVPFTIGDYDQYIEAGTGDGTFALGDFDGNGRVDAGDREALVKALGSTKGDDLEKFDLNGDNQIDIVDLAYVNHNANTSALRPEARDTRCIAVQADETRMRADMTAAGTTAQGDLSGLLREETSSVTFQNSTGSGDIQIPVPLTGPVTAENVQIVTPDTAPGAIQEGNVLVEYEENGQAGSISLPFSSELAAYAQAGIHAITRTPGTNVITIPLGRRVAVKKITITVTKTAGGEYAAIETIRFLKDIVPEELTEPNSQVKNLSAVPGDSRVSLTWNELPNVSGYRVDYWEKGQESARRQLNVDVAQAQITGLSNLKTYCFTVTPVDGGWQGKISVPVEAVPQPAKAPAAPDMVSVAALDGQLKVSWKAAENATWYEVYYTDQAGAPTSAYRQTGGRLAEPGITIEGLTNGTTYYLYVIAGNEMGRSGPSRISSGTPKATDYSRPAGIPAEGILEGEDIERVWLADPKNVSPSSYTSAQPFKAENMYDGDFRTHWTSHSYGDGNWWDNKQVFASFSQPVDISSVIWVPRLDGSYPNNLRLYSVTVWRQGDDLKGPGTLVAPDPLRGGSASDHDTWLDVQNNPGATRFAVLPIEPVTEVVQVAITIEQKAYSAVSLSELMFMEYDPAHSLPDNIAALFADELRTRLADGVTREQIDALKARLDSDEKNYYLNLGVLADELALAEELFDAGTTSGVVLEGIQSRSSASDSAKYGQGGSDLQPLGAAAKAGQEITVYASGIPEGEKVTIYATQFNAEASAWQAKAGELANGRNILTIPKIGSEDTERGGSLYLTYSGSSPETIGLHVRGGTDIPVLELSGWYDDLLNESARKARIKAYVDELTDYVSAQNSSSLNVTEISTPTVLLSLPADAVLGANSQNQDGKVENLYQNVLAWEDLMHICKTTQGIDGTYENNSMTSRQNIRCMQMFAGAFMYAAGNHVGIGYGSCSGMVSGLPISKLPAGAAANNLFGWGIAHEIGHNMDKLGRAEVTNNIYSLMVQTYDGKDNTFASRLEKSGKYPAVFDKTAQGAPGESNNVFVQLGMYWQLHLAYDGASKDERGPMWFYNQFHKDWKEGTYTKGFAGLSNDEKVALTAAGVVKKDLTKFFTRWGMDLSSETKAKLASYSEETRALWYLSDQSRRERLNGAQPAAGTAAASAVLKEGSENTIQISIQANLTRGTLQGYEIVRNGESIAFVLPGKEGTAQYEDVIGTGNHRIYSYQVIPYDILGNQVGEKAVEAGEVRVAYDKLVAPDSYTVTRGENTVTFTLKNAAPVTGFKLTGGQLPQGEYTVSILTEKDKTLTARRGSFDTSASLEGGGFVAYFNNPAAEAGDTSIYTYDAKAVTITGIPQDLADEHIRLISYAGDDISFYPGAAMGLLWADWQYDEGDSSPDGLLEKGTLVILGSYRGDPVWCTAEVWGRFRGGDGSVTERPVEGVSIFLADPESLYGDASDISDGLLIFTPKYKDISELPEEICLKLFRTDVPTDASSRRVTAQTLWISTFDGSDLPTINLEGENP